MTTRFFLGGDTPDNAFLRGLKPTPGSPQARSEGCMCPVKNNANGKGFTGGRGLWITRSDCPLHGWSDPSEGKGKAR